jgi:hypothetical protein
VILLGFNIVLENLFCLFSHIPTCAKAPSVTAMTGKIVAEELLDEGLSTRDVSIIYHAGMNILGLEDGDEMA